VQHDSSDAASTEEEEANVSEDEDASAGSSDSLDPEDDEDHSTGDDELEAEADDDTWSATKGGKAKKRSTKPKPKTVAKTKPNAKSTIKAKSKATSTAKLSKGKRPGAKGKREKGPSKSARAKGVRKTKEKVPKKKKPPSGHGRKKIRRVIDSDRLDADTKLAQDKEKERLTRLAARKIAAATVRPYCFHRFCSLCTFSKLSSGFARHFCVPFITSYSTHSAHFSCTSHPVQLCCVEWFLSITFLSVALCVFVVIRYRML
jgi:hypothetical protein